MILKAAPVPSADLLKGSVSLCLLWRGAFVVGVSGIRVGDAFRMEQVSIPLAPLPQLLLPYSSHQHPSGAL